MLSIGNELCNSIWELDTRGRHKPMPQSSREEKESWIRSKYEYRDFLPILPPANMMLSEVRFWNMCIYQSIASPVEVVGVCYQ